MANKIKFACEEPATLLFSSITQKSAPRGVGGAEPKFSGTFGIGEKDFKRMIPVMVQCIREETGGFSGKPDDYYLACMGGNNAASRVLQKAELDAQAERGKGNQDEAFKIMERAEKRAKVYREFAGILTASSKYDINLAKLIGGAIQDIEGEVARAEAGKNLFTTGAIVVPNIALQGFRRKKLDDRDGVTAFLQNCLYLRKGPHIDIGGGAPSNGEVFGGFKNYSDYDPLANAPGGDDAWNNSGSGQGSQQHQNNGGQQTGNGSGSTTQSPSNDAWSNPGNGQGQNGQQGGGYQPQGGFQGGAVETAQW